MRGLPTASFALLALALPASVRAAEPEPDPEFRVSLPTESDEESWRHAGVRLALGYAYSVLDGLQSVPGGHVHSVVLRVGARIDAEWSLLGSFQYGLAASGVAGLRYAITLDPTWHVADHLELAVGLGLGGLVEAGTGRPDLEAAQRDGLVASYTFPNAHEVLRTCVGDGPTVLARAGYTWVLDDIWVMGVHAEGFGQWIACVEETGRVEPDTAEPIVRRQWWPLLGASVGLVFEWR